MAIQDMTRAVSGTIASSDDYNTVLDNVDDIDGRLQVAESRDDWPLCTVRRDAAWDLPNSAGTTVSFNRAEDDEFDMHAPGSSYVTIPGDQGGVYEIFGQVRFEDNPNGVRGVYLTINGSDTQANSITAQELSAAPASGKVVAVVSRKRLAGNDVVRMRAYQNSGGPLDLGGTTYGGTYLSILRVR